MMTTKGYQKCEVKLERKSKLLQLLKELLQHLAGVVD
jgi:hypothetical protein